VDNVIAVDVVSSDGRLRRASADENADLYWGVRGGGGNFGVVTSFEFRLHPMQRQVHAGDIMFPIARVRDVLALYGEYGPRAPDEMDLDCVLVQPPGAAPGMAGFSVCWSGDAAAGERALAPIRRLGTPMADTIRPMDYVAVQRSGDISDPRALGQYVKSGFISTVTPGLIDAIAEGFRGDAGRTTIMAFDQGGGAIGRVAPGATAFAQRDVMANMLGFVDWPFGAEPSGHIAWIKQFWTTLEPHTHGFYVNDLELDHSAATIRDNYRQNHDRLVAVKNAYDPKNLFRLNANVKPTA
jgi:FAD/FMN-containing dehydrogenase